MIEFLKGWYHKKFSDPSAVALVLMVSVGLIINYFIGDVLAPLFVAIAIAYLLEWPVAKMVRLGVYRTVSVTIVLLVFSTILAFMAITVFPSIMAQTIKLAKDMPSMITQSQGWLKTLPEQYPDMIDVTMIQSMLDSSKGHIIGYANSFLTGSLTSLGSIATTLVYGILVTVLVFFMLKDKEILLSSIKSYLPENRELISRVAKKMNEQIANYVRGKVIEIIIVGVVSYITFSLLDLRYALLIGVLAGFSVLIPFVGAAAVTVPIALIGLFQWGFTAPLFYVLLAYAIIQALDGNVLSPLLMAGAVNIHPTVIIVAVLVFGGLWGLWGVFFAIPLATLIEAIMNSWPKTKSEIPEEPLKA